MRWLTLTAVVWAGAASAEPPGRWFRPDASLLGQTSVGGVFNGDAHPTGRYDAREGGFHLQRLEIELGADAGKSFRVATAATMTLDGFDLDEAYAQTMSLPWGLGLRAGLFRSKVGHENERRSRASELVQQPLALGKIFGGRGHLALGAELSYDLPTSFPFELVAAAMSANGDGERSWFGDAEVPIEHPRDFAYQLGLDMKKEFATDAFASLGFDAILGPNDSGRTNATNVFAVALAFGWVREHTGVVVETEWFLRRRQIPGDALQDLLGWVQATGLISRDWALALRYERTHGLKGDPLDPDDLLDRHRGTLQVGWRPSAWSRLRLGGYVDFGGPNSKTADDGSHDKKLVGGMMLDLEVFAGLAGKERDDEDDD